MKTITACVALLAMLAFVMPASAEVTGKAIMGEPAPQFSLQDQDGKTVSLSDYAGKIIVLEWVNPKCPFVQRHYRAKTMITLANDYRDKDVVWLAIDTRHDSTNAENKAWVTEHHLTYPILNDSAGEVGKAYQAKTTPDMFIIGKDGRLLYSGAIDNDPSGDKTADRVNYVRQALDEILAGRPVSTPRTKSYGCGVHYGK